MKNDNEREMKLWFDITTVINEINDFADELESMSIISEREKEKFETFGQRIRSYLHDFIRPDLKTEKPKGEMK
jgi:hypothetical protein